jgi:parallel beta-helix repeat protein
LIVSNCQVRNNGYDGVLWESGADSQFLNNKIFNNGSTVGVGLSAYGSIQGNEVYGNYVGIAASSGLVENNVVRDNRQFGISVGNSSTVTVRNNTVFGQTVDSNAAGIYVYYSNAALVTGNRVYANKYGFYIYGNSSRGPDATIIEGNQIYRNTTAGIYGFYAVTVRNNRIYFNPIGVQLVSASSSRVYNNVIYANTNQAILIQGGSNHLLATNTVYQAVGDAVKIESSASNVTLANNILWVDVGFGINMATNSQTGFSSNYNLFYRGASSGGSVGSWSGVTRAALTDWQTANSQDLNSLSGNPLFLDIDGPDNVLGDPNVPQGNGDDDNFGLRANSPAIDAANAHQSCSLMDLLGLARRDDPGQTNTGVGFQSYVEQNLGSSLYAAVGTAGGYNPTVTLGFSFPFWGINYTQFRVSDGNGFIQFGDTSTTGFSDDNTLAAFAQKIRIAPLWDQLWLSSALFLDATVPNQYTIRWSGTRYGGAGWVNFSVTLFANGNIRFDYGPDNANLTPTIGLSAGNGIYLLSTYDGQANLGNANSILWTPQAGLMWFDMGAYEFQGDSTDVTPPQVVSVPTLPASGGSTATPFTAIPINFSEALNFLSGNASGNYALVGRGPDNTFDTGDDVLVTLTPTYTFGATQVVLTLPGGPLAADSYRVTLSGTKALYDTAGNPLDGDANGTGGDDYVHFFTVVNASPTVVATTVNHGEIQRSRVTRLVLEFSEDVSGSLGLDDLVLRNVTTSQVISPANLALSYDPGTNRATLTFPGLAGQILPDGNYELTVTAAGVTDSQGAPMSADYVFEFHVLTGDANGDRVTNDRDLYRVWQNLLKNPAARDLNEDLDGDSQVTQTDVALVKDNYLAILPLPPAPAPPAAPSPAASGALPASVSGISTDADSQSGTTQLARSETLAVVVLPASNPDTTHASHPSPDQIARLRLPAYLHAYDPWHGSRGEGPDRFADGQWSRIEDHGAPHRGADSLLSFETTLDQGLHGDADSPWKARRGELARIQPSQAPKGSAR